MESEKGNESQVSIATASPALDGYARIAQDFQLPNVVKLKLDADIQQAQSISIVITLLAGTLVTLTSILGGTNTLEEPNSAGWCAFRVILWMAIMSDIGEAIICIMAIKMCSELPLVAAERAMKRVENSNFGSRLSDKVERSASAPLIGLREVKNRYAMLEAVGMPRTYRLVDRLVIWFMLWAVVISLWTCYYRVCHTIIIVPAGIIIGFFALVTMLLITVFVMAMKFSRNWS